MMNPLNKDSPFSHVYFRSTKVIPHRKWEVYGKCSEIGVNPCIVFISYFSNRDFLHFRDIWLEGVSARQKRPPEQHSLELMNVKEQKRREKEGNIEVTNSNLTILDNMSAFFVHSVASVASVV